MLPKENVEENQQQVFGDVAHYYKDHDEVLSDQHVVIKDMPAEKYRSPDSKVINIYKWTTQPKKHLSKYEHHYSRI